MDIWCSPLVPMYAWAFVPIAINIHRMHTKHSLGTGGAGEKYTPGFTNDSSLQKSLMLVDKLVVCGVLCCGDWKRKPWSLLRVWIPGVPWTSRQSLDKSLNLPCKGLLCLQSWDNYPSYLIEFWRLKNIACSARDRVGKATQNSCSYKGKWIVSVSCSLTLMEQAKCFLLFVLLPK